MTRDETVTGGGLWTALRRARQEADLTLHELADRVGISAATLSRAERGHGTLTLERLARCARALGLEIADLAGATAGAGAVEAGASAESGDRGGGWRSYQRLDLDQVLQAALGNFLELGYHGTSMRDLARRAGLSVPGLYHHYPRKQDLLVAIMDMTMADFLARCKAAQAEGSDPEDRFCRLVECYALFHTNRRELAFIGASEMRSLEEPHRTRISRVRMSCQRMLTDEVQAMKNLGLAEVGDAEDVGRAAVSMLVGIANWYRVGGPVSPEELAQRYVVHARSLVALSVD